MTRDDLKVTVLLMLAIALLAVVAVTTLIDGSGPHHWDMGR